MTKFSELPIMERPLAAAKIAKNRQVIAADTVDDVLGMAPVCGFIRDGRFVAVAEVFSSMAEAMTSTLAFGCTGFAAETLTAVFDTTWSTETQSGDLLVQVSCTRGEDPVYRLMPYTVMFEQSGIEWHGETTERPAMLGLYGDIMADALKADSLAELFTPDLRTRIRKVLPGPVQDACDLFTIIAIQDLSTPTYFPVGGNQDTVAAGTVAVMPFFPEVWALWYQ